MPSMCTCPTHVKTPRSQMMLKHYQMSGVDFYHESLKQKPPASTLPKIDISTNVLHTLLECLHYSVRITETVVRSTNKESMVDDGTIRLKLDWKRFFLLVRNHNSQTNSELTRTTVTNKIEEFTSAHGDFR